MQAAILFGVTGIVFVLCFINFIRIISIQPSYKVNEEEHPFWHSVNVLKLAQQDFNWADKDHIDEAILREDAGMSLCNSEIRKMKSN
jgi:hypothetical protein